MRARESNFTSPIFYKSNFTSFAPSTTEQMPALVKNGDRFGLEPTERVSVWNNYFTIDNEMKKRFTS
jgi:hypothetical protein